ncbi:adenylosuccinate synthetase, partial [Vibrio parahaemolyticus]
EERASRKALLFGDLFNKGTLKAKLESALREKNFLLENFYKEKPVAVDEMLKLIEDVSEQLAPYRCKD